MIVVEVILVEVLAIDVGLGAGDEQGLGAEAGIVVLQLRGRGGDAYRASGPGRWPL